MKDKLKGIIIAGAAVAALAVGGATIAIAQGGDSGPAEAEEATENESAASEAAEAATGSAADEAAQTALDAVGGGKVLEVEHADDGESGYEVEVERPDGSYVEVNLDESGKVISTGGDD